MSIEITGLPLIGEGHHGKVYRLDNARCIKIYEKKSFMLMELKVLKHSERFPYFPKVYEYKDNYMIREYFEGPNLWQFIQQNGLSENLAVKILEIIDSFVELRYSKLDCHLHHIIVTDEGCLKVIDPTTLMSGKSSYPRALLEKLSQLGLKQTFLNYVETYRPHYYEHWISK